MMYCCNDVEREKSKCSDGKMNPCHLSATKFTLIFLSLRPCLDEIILFKMLNLASLFESHSVALNALVLSRSCVASFQGEVWVPRVTMLRYVCFTRVPIVSNVYVNLTFVPILNYILTAHVPVYSYFRVTRIPILSYVYRIPIY
jgi:hypothetical protein